MSRLYKFKDQKPEPNTYIWIKWSRRAFYYDVLGQKVPEHEREIPTDPRDWWAIMRVPSQRLMDAAPDGIGLSSCGESNYVPIKYMVGWLPVKGEPWLPK